MPFDCLLTEMVGIMKNNFFAKQKYAHIWESWLVVLSAFFIGFITDGVIYSFGIMLVELLEYFQGDRASTAAIGSIMSGTVYLSGPLTGALCDRYGCRNIVMIGAVVSCTGLAASAFATNIYYLYISYGLVGGFGVGLMYLPAGVSVIKTANKHLALANGIALCGSGLGTVAFNQIAHYLIQQYGWRGTLLLEAGIVLNGAIMGIFLLPAPRRNTTLANGLSNTALDISSETCRNGNIIAITGTCSYSGEIKFVDGTTLINVLAMDEVKLTSCTHISKVSNTRIATIAHPQNIEIIISESINPLPDSHSIRQYCQSIFHVELLSELKVAMYLLSGFVINLALIIPFSFIPDQAVQSGMTKYEAAWLTSTIGITNTISRICIGWIGDHPKVSRFVLLEMMLFLAATSTGMSILLTTFATKLIYTCLYGVAIGGFITLQQVVLADMCGKETIANSYGLMLFFIGAGHFVATPYSGWIRDMTGGYDLSFVVAGVLFLVGGAMNVLPYVCNR